MTEWNHWRWTRERLARLDRLVRPIKDVLAVAGARSRDQANTLKILILESGRHGRTFWGWTRDEWLGLLRYGQAAFAASKSRHAFLDQTVLPKISRNGNGYPGVLTLASALRFRAA
jgi:hypothetical protein